MLQRHPTSLKVDSDSEEEKTPNVHTQKPQENVTENNTNYNQEENTREVKTSNEGEDDDDDDTDDKSHCRYCINLSDYIDINQTKYYDAIVILSSFVNFVFNIILIIDFDTTNNGHFLECHYPFILLHTYVTFL